VKVLVTGHLGYIGTALVPMLQARGHEVIGWDSDLFRRCTYGDPAGLPKVPTLEIDLRDLDQLQPGALADFDGVLHLAGLSNDPLGDLDPGLTDAINHHASVAFARAARDAGVERFVFSSSCSNYGAGGDTPLDESAPSNPVTPYGASKVAVELALAELTRPGFSPVFLRNATAYGASVRLRFDLVVNNLTAWAFTTGKVLLKSDGRSWRPLVHIEDIARAFIATLEAPAEQVAGEAFNITSSSENYLIRDVAEIVAEEVPGSTVTFADDHFPDVRNYRVLGDKFAAAFPEFAPRWTVREGVRELLAVYQERGLTLDQFEGPAFRRVDHIRQLIDDGVLLANLRHR
jgi:nucleoside-diphosphate-sugar epimerase